MTKVYIVYMTKWLASLFSRLAEFTMVTVVPDPAPTTLFA